jgi:uncharacterized protein YutE (UPF0331/DUF86 family)
MEQERVRLYEEKRRYIEDTLSSVPKWVGGDLEKDEDLNAVHNAIDASLELARMILKDIGHEISSDEENIEALTEEDIIEAPLAERLKRIAALRKDLVDNAAGTPCCITLMRELEQVKSSLLEYVNYVDDFVYEVREE